jgi:hypothetical protein
MPNKLPDVFKQHQLFLDLSTKEIMQGLHEGKFNLNTCYLSIEKTDFADEELVVYYFKQTLLNEPAAENIKKPELKIIKLTAEHLAKDFNNDPQQVINGLITLVSLDLDLTLTLTSPAQANSKIINDYAANLAFPVQSKHIIQSLKAKAGVRVTISTNNSDIVYIENNLAALFAPDDWHHYIEHIKYGKGEKHQFIKQSSEQLLQDSKILDVVGAVLVDDDELNCNMAEGAGITTIQVNKKNNKHLEKLSVMFALGCEIKLMEKPHLAPSKIISRRPSKTVRRTFSIDSNENEFKQALFTNNIARSFSETDLFRPTKTDSPLTNITNKMNKHFIAELTEAEPHKKKLKQRSLNDLLDATNKENQLSP